MSTDVSKFRFVLNCRVMLDRVCLAVYETAEGAQHQIQLLEAMEREKHGETAVSPLQFYYTKLPYNCFNAYALTDNNNRGNYTGTGDLMQE